MPEASTKEILEADFFRGIDRLRSLIEEAGFKFALTEKGTSSGGFYLTGVFSKAGKQMSLSFRHSLGLVAYTVGTDTLSHEDYMWALGLNGLYPGLSTDRVAAFEHLCADLKIAGGTFLNQPDSEFENLARKCRENPKRTGFGALGIPR